MKNPSRNSASLRAYWFILWLSRSNPVFRLLIDLAAVAFYKLFRSDSTFIFNGKKYKYFYHIYNRTVAGERIVEIPIAYDVLKQYQGKDILEFGNVLHHYFPVTHQVLDKYEKGLDVINEDVVTFNSKRKYDLILSISTMEHVGFTYGEKLDGKKIQQGIANLKRQLKPGGKMYFTLPIYYNPYLTKLILDENTGFSKTYYMKRYSFLNEWKQVPFKEIKNSADYDGWFANSNALFIGEYVKK